MTENCGTEKEGIDFCPFCERISLTLPKLSHLDEQTHICSLCGHIESMLEFKYLFNTNSRKIKEERLNRINSVIHRIENINSHKFRYLTMIKSLMGANLKHIDS
ncbi:hypothetical protein LCGC14_0730590 [marine sediment metagenome]|uniref:Uncharacterized protein n=1 Tax=marine sediment metagenome TaxID=412755 RepID=A0A0F9Q9Q9_9ZZZZ|nr:hypothetical protein [archaeon]